MHEISTNIVATSCIIYVSGKFFFPFISLFFPFENLLQNFVQFLRQVCQERKETINAIFIFFSFPVYNRCGRIYQK